MTETPRAQGPCDVCMPVHAEPVPLYLRWGELVCGRCRDRREAAAGRVADAARRHDLGLSALPR